MNSTHDLWQEFSGFAKRILGKGALCWFDTFSQNLNGLFKISRP